MPPEEFQTSAHADASGGSEAKPPPLVALFLIKFDLKVGYTIAWKRSIEGVPLEGVVEYKSLPSGLHNVEEDLVYFFHEQYAGISAFAKCSASEQERNAHFVAVGAMLPLKDGRLGRAWLHAEHLMKLSKELVLDSNHVDSLVEYWEEHGALTNDDFASPQLSPFTLAQRKTRALSSATLAMDAKKTLPAFHPALAILDYIDVFGPLIFPLHRAALLRKRILLITSPPIRQACEFVYDLSIFSSTPISLANSLILPSEELVRLRPLFSVGIHDIPLLEDFAKGSALPSSILSPENDSAIAEDDDEEEEPPTQPKNIGWLACTTDEILVMKPKLYDISIEMPTSHLGHPKGRRRPVIKLAGETKEMKATQRDWRRYKTLRRALRPLMMLSSSNEDGQGDLNHENDIPLILKSFSTSEHEDVTPDDGDGVEPMTWSELAYSSFMWWASAGEKNESFIEEESQDIAMLGDLGELVRQIADSKRYTDENDEEDDVDSVEDETSNPTAMAESSQRKDARLQMEIISYFHRLTKNIFDVCSDVLSQDIDDGDINFDEGVSRVDHDALRSMGLDGWSASDREFVRSFFELWFEREVHVDPLSVECCGVRVC